MQTELIGAIKGRQYVSFVYDGIMREVQPATLGMLSTGALALRCYQTAGGHRNSGHAWDLCKLDKISQLKVLSKTFANDPPGYKRGDKQMMRVLAQL